MSLKRVRRSKKITQTELANRIGVSRDTIARIESGKARIYLAQALAMADALDILLRDLLMQEKQKERMIVMDENMSVSQPNVLIKFLSNNSGGGQRQGKGQRTSNQYFTQPAVEIYGESMKDYILNHRLFWHWVPGDKLVDLSISSVVEATLNLGNEKDISDMFNMIGVEKAADVFKHGISGFRTNYREDTITYFSQYFRRHVPEYSDR